MPCISYYNTQIGGRRNEILIYATTWLNQKDTILCEKTPEVPIALKFKHTESVMRVSCQGLEWEDGELCFNGAVSLSDGEMVLERQR